jgi:diadenosine tetraphosphate (Ap4A) HIT family hydrolase
MNAEPCCRLGAELPKKEHVLYEADNFFVTPCLGQIGIQGYLLLCSKEHFSGVGGLPRKLHSELEEVLLHAKKVLGGVYQSEILVFEHGPRIGCYKGGGCLDHTHLHIIPINYQLIEPVALRFLRALAVKDFYKVERIEGFHKLTDLFEAQQASYLFVETNDEKRFTTEVNFVLPSQYLRQVIAQGVNREDKWNWKDNPDYETFERTLENLYGKFKN